MLQRNDLGALVGATEASDRVYAKLRLDTTTAPNTATRVAIDRLRRQHAVEAVWRLGPRVVFELLDELDRRHGLGDELEERLARYAELDPLILAAVGGDQFAPAPIRMVTSAA
jgi:hypothetical protein